MFLLGMGLFVWRFGTAILNPSAVDWLIGQLDPAAYYLGWLFFRSEPWQFPPGAIAAYNHPVGASVAITGAIPLPAFAGKALGAILPNPFQYFGLWLLISHGLQAVFGYLLSGIATADRRLRLLGGLLFLLAPVFLHGTRHMFFGLSSHWLILAALWLTFIPLTPGNQSRVVWARVALVVISPLINHYLVPFTCGIVAASFFCDWLKQRAGGWQKPVFITTALAACVLLEAYLVGFFQFRRAADFGLQGFGHYSTNLNGLFDPFNTSRLLPALGGPGEPTYSYLGVGLLALLAVALVVALVVGLRKTAHIRHLWHYLPLGVVMVGFLLLALGNQIHFGHASVLHYPLPGAVETAVASLRTNGRLLWPVYYLLIFAVIATLVRFKPVRFAWLLLLPALALQAYDISPLLNLRGHVAGLSFQTRLIDPIWDVAMGRAKHLVTVPPFRRITQYGEDYKDFALLAAKHHGTVTVAYLGRSSAGQSLEAIAHIEQRLLEGKPAADTLYVFNGLALIRHAPTLAHQFTCHRADGYWLCAGKDSGILPANGVTLQPMSLARYLAASQNGYTFMVSRETPNTTLAPYQQTLAKLSPRLAAEGFIGAYLGVMAGGKLALEQIDPKQIGASLPNTSLPNPVFLLSGDGPDGKQSSIRVDSADGPEWSLNGAGLNLLHVDRQMRPVSVANFGHHPGDQGTVIYLLPPANPNSR
jgi:hypothetical protein